MGSQRKCNSPLKYGGFRYNPPIQSSDLNFLGVEILNLMTILSPFWDVTFHSCSALHCILESSELIGVFAGRGSEMRFCACSVFRDGLASYAGSRIIGLVLVEFLQSSVRTARFRQCPTGHVALCRRVSCCFWHIATWSHGGWR